MAELTINQLLAIFIKMCKKMPYNEWYSGLCLMTQFFIRENGLRCLKCRREFFSCWLTIHPVF